MKRTSLDFPHYFLLPKNNQWEQDQWCTEHFGKRWCVVDNRQGTWCCFWRGLDHHGMYEWYFQHEQDATRFILRWM